MPNPSVRSLLQNRGRRRNDSSWRPAFFSRNLLSAALLGTAIYSSSFYLTSLEQAHAQTAAKRSYLQYQPVEADFPAALRDLVRSIAALPSDAATSAGAPLLKQIEAKRAGLSRGYHDELWFLEGLVQERIGAEKAALAAYNSALRLSSNSPPALFRKAIVLEALQRHEEALAAAKEFLWLSKSNKHEAKLVVGRVLCTLNRCEEGLAEVEAALLQSPRFVPALEFLVAEKRKSLAAVTDPTKKAEVEAQVAADLFRLVQLDPDNREAALSHARYSLRYTDPLVHGEKLREAEQIARKFVERSSYKDAEAVRLLFDVYARRGKTQEAHQVLELGLAATPDSPLLADAKRQLAIQQKVDSLQSTSAAKK